MRNQEKEKIGLIFFNTLQKLVKNRPRLDQRLLEYEYDVFQSIIVDLTGTDRLLFNTLFARIAYLGLQHRIPPDKLYELHLFRKEFHNLKVIPKYETLYQLGLYLIAYLLNLGYGKEIPKHISEKVTKPTFRVQTLHLAKFEFNMRGLLTKYDQKIQRFHFISQNNADKDLLMDTLELDLFQENVAELKNWAENGELPLTVELHDVGIDKEGVLYPKWLVIEPDYLVDVTSVAECFTHGGARPENYLLHKFIPVAPSKYLLIGQIVNFILDELIHNIEMDFKSILGRIFRLAPLTFSILEEKEVHEIVLTVKDHYDHLLRVLKEDFPKLNLDPLECIVEPSFYAPLLGIQGRLDVLHQNEGKQQSIIELKSGRPFRENMYGLSVNHYTQTLLYDLMIRSVYKLKSKPLNYILYSKLNQQNLRFAPTVRAAQLEAITVRNSIYAIERKLLHTDTNKLLFDRLKIINFPTSFGFNKHDIEHFEEVYAGLDEIEKEYFSSMTSFISLEHHLAKTGYLGLRDNNGLAALWLEALKVKEDRFAVLSSLKISENYTMKDPPVISFLKTDNTNALANFRVGDIVVLRPMYEEDNKSISDQVVRATLIELSEHTLKIKLRSRQYNQGFFKEHDLWKLETDFLDSGFRKMYQSLFSFASAKKHKRSLLLGRELPQKPVERIEVTSNGNLTSSQNEILNKLLSSPEYFLLWGPPGTGKTSVLLAGAVEWLLENTDQNILLLAYTNRAVDEICEMVDNLKDGCIDYIRIGSKYASGEVYRKRLLDHKLEKLNSRAKLKTALDETRVFTGTTSSISGKTELFQLKKFDVVFIDEASQILEPMIIGLLPLFKKFVLIGDHKQLPAVVVQDKNKSLVHSETLNELGFIDNRTAFFERIYLRALANNWDWCIGQLFEQGRMHSDIQDFPNEVFYDGKLKYLDKMPELKLPLAHKFPASHKNDPFAKYRMIFIDCKGDENFDMAKNNASEALIVAELVQYLRILYENSLEKGKEISIGIITPFRAQIAQIRSIFQQKEMDSISVSIDTVERYQGGARDIIIYSTVVNSSKRLEQVVSKDSQGVDRKLNVALTRAREQFILLGNKTILAQNGLYRQLIDKSKEISQKSLF